jgi:hypothetical protein
LFSAVLDVIHFGEGRDKKFNLILPHERRAF